jgi:hypothetical protein
MVYSEGGERPKRHRLSISKLLISFPLFLRAHLIRRVVYYVSDEP